MVMMLGEVIASHQPVVPISAGSSSEVKKSPRVGTSQSRPMNASTMYTGVRARKRTILDDIGSDFSAGTATGASIGAAVVAT